MKFRVERPMGYTHSIHFIWVGLGSVDPVCLWCFFVCLFGNMCVSVCMCVYFLFAWLWYLFVCLFVRHFVCLCVSLYGMLVCLLLVCHLFISLFVCVLMCVFVCWKGRGIHVQCNVQNWVIFSEMIIFLQFYHSLFYIQTN